MYVLRLVEKIYIPILAMNLNVLGLLKAVDLYAYLRNFLRGLMPGLRSSI